jgi:hypothetical protein
MPRFVVLDYTGRRLGTYDHRDAAAGAIQDALRESGADEVEAEQYDVVECGFFNIVEIGPALGDCSEEEYEVECDRLQNCYTQVEGDTQYTVCVRPAYDGEVSGMYLSTPTGRLQILGYSFPKPDDLEELSERAFALFCKAGSVDTHKVLGDGDGLRLK